MSDYLLAVAAQLDAEPEMPADLLAALEAGELTMDQLRRLIAWEAGQMGLSFDEAVRRSEDGTLPKTVIGLDVDLLIRMLPD